MGEGEGEEKEWLIKLNKNGGIYCQNVCFT
jgi:hypothetical protein